MREIYDALVAVFDTLKPNALAYEVYTPFRAQGGSAWKCARVEGLIQTMAFARGLPTLPFLPVDLKTGICRKRSASKQEIEAALGRRLDGFSLQIAHVVAGNREHVADAAGYALLGLQEIWQLQRLTGGEHDVSDKPRNDSDRNVARSGVPGSRCVKRRAARRIGSP